MICKNKTGLPWIWQARVEGKADNQARGGLLYFAIVKSPAQADYMHMLQRESLQSRHFISCAMRHLMMVWAARR